MTDGGTGEALQRILVVEDDREVRYLLSVVLDGPGREVVTVETAAQAAEVLQAQEVSLVFLDLLLPDADGRTLLGRMRGRPGTASVPVVVASARASADIRAECFSLGADAFWEKPFDPQVVAEDVSARLRWRAQRERQALTDDLTGFLNRAGILQALDEERDALRRLILAELDGFRSLSDRYGWGTAERIAWEVGHAVEEILPDGAHLGRMGGGEFAVIVRGADGKALARKVLEAGRRVPVEGPDGETFRVTVSVALVEDPGDREGEALLEEAEGLLYRAREAGGNQVVASGARAAEGSGPILIAEDDDITAKILTHRLEKEGLEVIRYADGASAYRGAMEITPSLVILDVKMPGMDGFEVLERLRKTPAYAQVPIVLLTSMGSEGDVVRAFQLGADDYILKPFSPAELIARVHRLARRGRTVAPA